MIFKPLDKFVDIFFLSRPFDAIQYSHIRIINLQFIDEGFEFVVGCDASCECAFKVLDQDALLPASRDIHQAIQKMLEVLKGSKYLLHFGQNCLC